MSTNPQTTDLTTNCEPSRPVYQNDLWLGFDPYCPKLEAAKKAVADWYTDGLDKGRALVLAGGYGCGKTHLARVVVRAYSNPASVWMLSESDLIAHIRSTYGGDGSEKVILATLRRVKLLILDDVGTAYVKAESHAWLEDIYWRILDRRAELKLGTLITTNLNFKDLGTRIGGRAFSRLLGMMVDRAGYVDMFGVSDYRIRGWKQSCF